jgi:diguanylate cyclase (GGDEF)-like protein/PAS domain S-box-containing protein
MQLNQHPSLQGYIDLLLDTLCVVDKNGVFIYVSPGSERIFGYTPEEMIGKPMIDLVFPEDRARTLNAVSEIMAGHYQTNFENRYIHKNGKTVHILWSARWSESDQIRVAVARDISESKRAEALQKALYSISEAAYTTDELSALLKHIHKTINKLIPALNFSVVLEVKPSNDIVFSYHFEEDDLLDASPFDTGKLCRKIIQNGETLLLTSDKDNNGNNFRSWLGVPLKSQSAIIGAMAVYSHSGNHRYSERDQKLLEFVSTQIASAIERKQMLTRLQHMALYDQLTQLANRELLHDRLSRGLLSAKRHKNRIAVLYLDLDKFKQVNDAFGHDIGDELLQQTAQRILGCVRESDTVSRLSGDEFVVLLEDIESQNDVLIVAEKIRDSFSQPFILAGRDIAVLPSIGIAIFPEHGSNEKELLRKADQAMYAAKRNGGNCIHIH